MVVIQFDIVELLCDERDGAGFGRCIRFIHPIVNKQLAVDVEADAVVGGSVEKIRLAELRFNRVRSACSPVEIDGGVGLHQNGRASEWAGASVVRVIRASQPDAAACRRRVDERRARHRAIDSAGCGSDGLNQGATGQGERPGIKHGISGGDRAVQRVINGNSGRRVRERDNHGISESASARRNDRRGQEYCRAINRQGIFGAYINFSAGDYRRSHLDRTARIVARQVLAGVIQFQREIRGVIGAQDRRAAAEVGVGLNAPGNAVVCAVGGDRRRSAGETVAGGGTRFRGGDDEPVGDEKGLHHVAIALVVNPVVEVGGRTPNASNRARQPLHDLIVTGGIELTHVVAIYQKNFSGLASTYNEMRMAGAAGGIREQERPA